jgi:hypothetical protein
VPIDFSSLTNVSISLPSVLNIFSVTCDDFGIEYFIIDELLNGFGKFCERENSVGNSL